jgi:hypothetical protein
MTDSALGVLIGGLPARNHARTWHAFLAAVFLASLLPFVALPFAQHVLPDKDSGLEIVAALTFVGANFHVAASAWFYTDQSLHSHFRGNPLRYLLAPALLIAASAAAFQFAPPLLRGGLLVPFFGWQLWHYQKQNFGLLSFIAAGTDGLPVSVWERRTFALSAAAGIAGFFHLYGVGLPQFSAEFALLHQLGKAVYGLAAIAFCVALARNEALRRNGLRLACFTFGTLFFLPTFLFGDWISATLSYAVAHGLQYMVFMAVVALGRPNPVASLAMLLGLATLGALALNAAILAPGWSDLDYGYALYGAFVGVTMSHFVLDAGLWRLREPFQRRYMRQKFHFVFNR